MAWSVRKGGQFSQCRLTRRRRSAGNSAGVVGTRSTCSRSRAHSHSPATASLALDVTRLQFSYLDMRTTHGAFSIFIRIYHSKFMLRNRLGASERRSSRRGIYTLNANDTVRRTQIPQMRLLGKMISVSALRLFLRKNNVARRPTRYRESNCMPRILPINRKKAQARSQITSRRRARNSVPSPIRPPCESDRTRCGGESPNSPAGRFGVLALFVGW